MKCCRDDVFLMIFNIPDNLYSPFLPFSSNPLFFKMRKRLKNDMQGIYWFMCCCRTNCECPSSLCYKEKRSATILTQGLIVLILVLFLLKVSLLEMNINPWIALKSDGNPSLFVCQCAELKKSPSSHVCPVQPSVQTQLKPAGFSTQVAPFIQGDDKHACSTDERRNMEKVEKTQMRQHDKRQKHVTMRKEDDI